jgi:hypothetical protein
MYLYTEQVVIQRLSLRYWKVWVKLYSVSLMIINALKKLGDKGRKGIQFRAKIPFSFRVSCNN